MIQADLFGGGGEKANRKVDAEFILLDYVQTLVQNGNDPRRDPLMRSGRYRDWIRLEEPRAWLVDLLKGRKVILVTARSAKYRAETLEQVRKFGLPLVASFFNPGEMEPPSAKHFVLRKHIYPKFGEVVPGRYLALESNQKTRAMYDGQGIVSMPVPYGKPWTVIPQIKGP